MRRKRGVKRVNIFSRVTQYMNEQNYFIV